MIQIDIAKGKNIVFAAFLLLTPIFLNAQSGACPTTLADVSALFASPEGTGIALENSAACFGGGVPGPLGGPSLGTPITIDGQPFTASGGCDGNGREVYGNAGSTMAVTMTAGYTVIIPVGGATETCNYTQAGVLILVPTLSEWGLIILGLLILTIGVVYANEPTLQTVNSQSVQTSFSLNRLPFERNSFFKIWAGIAALVFAGFLLAVNFFGYEMTTADPYGCIVASAIGAYMMMALKMESNPK